MDKIKQYVENAITDGREVTRYHYANNCNYSCDYVFIKENDGWISIIGITDGIYSAVIQAKDMKHALEFIALREPLTVPVTIL